MLKVDIPTSLADPSVSVLDPTSPQKHWNTNLTAQITRIPGLMNCALIPPDDALHFDTRRTSVDSLVNPDDVIFQDSGLAAEAPLVSSSSHHRRNVSDA